MFVSTVIVGIGISFNYPSLMAMTVNAVPEREQVRAISTFTMFFEIGTATGALLFGTLADFTTKRTAFLGGAGFCCHRARRAVEGCGAAISADTWLSEFR